MIIIVHLQCSLVSQLWGCVLEPTYNTPDSPSLKMAPIILQSLLKVKLNTNKKKNKKYLQFLLEIQNTLWLLMSCKVKQKYASLSIPLWYIRHQEHFFMLYLFFWRHRNYLWKNKPKKKHFHLHEPQNIKFII